MAKAKKAKLINLTLPNKVGTLAKVSDIISSVGANINAISARGDKRRAYFSIWVDQHMKAKNALIKAKYNVADEDVILVEMSNNPGQMQKVAKRLAENNIDILYVYGSAGTSRTSVCVLKTDNDKKAIGLIQRK
jgi:hypothetical protein